MLQGLMSQPIEASRLAVLRGLTGLISDDVGLKLATLAREVPRAQCIVEIGSYLGKSAAYLATGAQAGRGAPVFCVDPWDLEGNPGGRFGFNARGMVAQFLGQLERAGVLAEVTAFRAYSIEVAKTWTRPIGLLYIDGSHTETDVAKDWHAWRPHLAAGARVVFDDYRTKNNPGVQKVVDAIADLADWSYVPAPLAIGRLK